jgi:hypothetical protein
MFQQVGKVLEVGFLWTGKQKSVIVRSFILANRIQQILNLQFREIINYEKIKAL